MPESTQLSDLQLAVMRVLWDEQEATAARVHAKLLHERELAPTTVATLLSRLEKRGLVSHKTKGRQYLYRSEVPEGAVRHSMLRRLTEFFFAGDEAALVSHLVGSDASDSSELAALREVIAARESKSADEG